MEINGIKLELNKISQLFEMIEKNIFNKKSGVVATIDLLGIDLSYRNMDYLLYLKSANMIFLDGAGVILAAKLMGKTPPPRIAGADLFLKINKFAADNSYRIFLYGAKEETLKRLNKKLRKRYPGLIICGMEDGYSKKSDEVIEIIKRCNPDILFVALGVPHQERFIGECLKNMTIPLVMGVGGSFDVHSGVLKRAPKFMQKIGLEWLFRLIQEPRRIKRIYRIPFTLLRIILKRFSRKE